MLDDELKTAILSERADTAALNRRVMQQIRGDAVRWPDRWLFAAAGIAAIFIAGVPAWFALFPVRVDGTFAAAANDHHIELVDLQPRKWRTGLTEIADLAAQEGLSETQLTALTPAGYHLEQGKRCRLGGRIYLHLVYSSGPARLSMFIGLRPQPATDRRIQTADSGKEHIAGFAAESFDLLVVTRQPGGEAGKVARHAATLL